MEERLLTITEAAKILGISVDTLRRWDKSGKLVAIRKEGGVHRYYRQHDLDLFTSDLIKLAHDWTTEDGFELLSMFYCANSAVFQTRLIKMQDMLVRSGLSENLLPLIVAIAGESGASKTTLAEIISLFYGPDQTLLLSTDDLHKYVRNDPAWQHHTLA